jgi:predicted nucleic acid-binding protein
LPDIVGHALADEILEKLTAQALDWETITDLLARLELLAEWVSVPTESVMALLPDPDDNVVAACAVIGQAQSLVACEPHFEPLGVTYQGIKITKTSPFLWAARGDVPPG